MNPELANKLMELPEGRDLRDFLLEKLNELSDIRRMFYTSSLTESSEIALEALSRQRACQTLYEMLSPLIENIQFDIIQENDDSISTEMLQEKRSQDSNPT